MQRRKFPLKAGCITAIAAACLAVSACTPGAAGSTAASTVPPAR
jgi:hypothetical protein